MVPRKLEVVPVGILVQGDNHFIVRGPRPTAEEARRIVRRWSLIAIGSGIDMTRAEDGFPWRASTREFREDLEWAMVVEDPRAHSAAVARLLEELAARGVTPERVPID